MTFDLRVPQFVVPPVPMDLLLGFDAQLLSHAEIQSVAGPAAFLSTNSAVPQLVPQIPSSPDREPIRILVVGRTAPSINSIVYALYLKRFAHISEWSDLQPHSPGRLMRVLTRYVSGEDR